MKNCPLCGDAIGKYPAISRADNKTEICSQCGMQEALAVFMEFQKGEMQKQIDALNAALDKFNQKDN